MFLLVPVRQGSPGQRAVKRSLLCSSVNCNTTASAHCNVKVIRDSKYQTATCENDVKRLRQCIKHRHSAVELQAVNKRP